MYFKTMLDIVLYILLLEYLKMFKILKYRLSTDVALGE